jgi:hypothetical protein
MNSSLKYGMDGKAEIDLLLAWPLKYMSVPSNCHHSSVEPKYVFVIFGL